MDNEPLNFDKKTAQIFCNLFYDIQAYLKEKKKANIDLSDYFSIKEFCSVLSYNPEHLKSLFEEMHSNCLLTKAQINGKEYYCFNIKHSSLQLL